MSTSKKKPDPAPFERSLELESQLAELAAVDLFGEPTTTDAAAAPTITADATPEETS